MAYTVTELISGAYYASGIIAREFQTIEGQQVKDGLGFLNDILGQKRIESDMIPYNTSTTFNTVIGQEEYTIDNLIEATTMTFVLDSVRYQMVAQDRNKYFGTPRANNIDSLPLTFHVERILGGATVYLYFLPNAVYPVTIRGLFALAEVSLNQDLSASLDRFYITYLKYALADRICTEFNTQVPDGVQKTLKEYQLQISRISQKVDLKGRPILTLDSKQPLNYGQINIGKGWTPV